MGDQSVEAKVIPSTFSFGTPGMLAIAIHQAGSDLAAGVFLYRIKWRWGMKNKLVRFDKEWVAMSREQWASECGLTFHVFVKRALPRLRKMPYVDIRAMKITPGHPKSLWVSYDETKLPDLHQ